MRLNTVDSTELGRSLFYWARAPSAFEVRSGITPAIDPQHVCAQDRFAAAACPFPSLRHVIDLFVQRNKELWRAPDVQNWLVTAVSAVLDDENNENDSKQFIMQRKHRLTFTSV